MIMIINVLQNMQKHLQRGQKKKTRRGKENASRIIAYIISHETIDCCVRFYEIKYFKNCKWVSLFLLLGRETYRTTTGDASLPSRDQFHFNLKH